MQLPPTVLQGHTVFVQHPLPLCDLRVWAPRLWSRSWTKLGEMLASRLLSVGKNGQVLRVVADLAEAPL